MRPPRCLLYRPPPLLLKAPICRQYSIAAPRQLLPRVPPSYSDPRLSPSSPQLLTVRDIPAPHIGCIRVISLNSPHNRNAISRQLLSELRAELDALWTQDGTRGGPRVLILASELDGAFCAGADLKERSMMNETETKAFLNNLRSTLIALSNLRIPTITAIASIALGGGLELALATTLRIFSTVAQVGLPETRLGIIPGAGGTYRLRKLIGESEAQRLILTGRPITGVSASRLGLCNYVINCEKAAKRTKGDSSVDTTTDVKHEETATEAKEENTEEDDRGENGKVDGRKKSKVGFEDGVDRKARILNQAIRIAREICLGGPVAVSAAFGAVRVASYDAEARGYEFCLDQGDEDRREALAAFNEKRWPRFSGRQPDFKFERLKSLKMEKDGAEGVVKPEEGEKISNVLAAFEPRFSGRLLDFKLKGLQDLEIKRLQDLEMEKDGGEGVDKPEAGENILDVLDSAQRRSSNLSKLNTPDEKAKHTDFELLESRVGNLRAKEERLMGQFHAISQMKEIP